MYIGRNKSKGNDIGSFDVFYMQWQPKLLYFMEHFLKDHETARDLCQDVFLKLWDKRDQLPELRDPENYLFRMGKNAIFNYFEHNSVEERYLSEAIRNADKSADTEEQLFATQLKQAIELTIAAMPEQRQKIWRMSREQGMKNEDIARQLNISKRTVENHLSNALRQLHSTAKSMRLLLIII